MKQKLVKELEQLRNTGIIGSYNFDITREEDGNRECAVLVLSIDKIEVLNKRMSYNPERQRFGRIVDILTEQAETQLLMAGIMGLYSNKKSTINDRREADSYTC